MIAIVTAKYGSSISPPLHPVRYEPMRHPRDPRLETAITLRLVEPDRVGWLAPLDHKFGQVKTDAHWFRQLKTDALGWLAKGVLLGNRTFSGRQKARPAVAAV